MDKHGDGGDSSRPKNHAKNTVMSVCGYPHHAADDAINSVHPYLVADDKNF